MKQTFSLLAAALALLAFSGWISSQDKPAYYSGGIEAVDSYMQDSAHYPEAEKKAGKEGFVIVRFDVSEKGVAQNPVITSLVDSSAAFNAEARRLIAAMPTWEPARNKKGKAVSSSHRTFLKFELPDSLITIPLLSGDTIGEQMPRFPGAGEAGFQYYLHEMIRYPQVEHANGKYGTVYMYFDVEKTGRISNVKCARGVPGAPGLEKEAIRVISLMPRWKPGAMGGKPVKVGMTVPVKFTLQ